MKLTAAPSVFGRPAPRLAPPAKVTDPFYLSREWRDLVSAVKRQRGYVCEEPTCRRDCRAVPRALIGDHIVERADGGADLDPLNIRLLCTACHNRKTARSRGMRAAHGTSSSHAR
jgi:5-methylcytosine-specific restriction protein A